MIENQAEESNYSFEPYTEYGVFAHDTDDCRGILRFEEDSRIGVCEDCSEKVQISKKDYDWITNEWFEDYNEAWEEYMQLYCEERIERTADAWDKMADEWFTDRGWTKPHMAYDTDRGTGTLWVVVDFNDDGSQVWEDTGIPAREGDSLLCEGWDEAEYVGFQEWLKEQGEEE